MAKLKHECLIYITTSRELPCEDSDVTFVHLPKWGTQDDRNLLLIVGLDNGSVLEYDIHESCIDECIPTMTHRGHNDTISAIDTINEGKRILTISHDGTFIEWKKESLKSYVFNKNDIQKPPLLSLLLMLDEFYTGDVQGSIKAYHSSNKQFLRRHRVNSSPVTHIKHYNNSCFISGHMDGRICLWQRKEEVPPRRVLRGLNTALSGLAVHPEGFAYASTGGCTSDVLVRSLPLDSLSNDVIKTLNSTSRLPIDRVSLSWDLTSGWQDQLFPSDISCMFLYTDDTDSGDNISKKPDDTIKEYRLITGHFDGKVKVCSLLTIFIVLIHYIKETLTQVWLTEGRSSEAIAASRKCIYLNDKLYAAERELEDLRIIEEREFEVLTSIKHSRKPYFGLTLLLTSATEITRLLPGINCLKNSTRVRPAEDDLTPDLNKVFQNSLDSRPELLWTGLQALRRHVAAEEAGPAVRAKDAVDAKREEIAQVRELAVAADRNITDILAKGQLLQSMSALSSSITVISASAGMQKKKKRKFCFIIKSLLKEQKKKKKTKQEKYMLHAKTRLVVLT